MLVDLMMSSLLQRLQTFPVSEWQTSQKEVATFNSKTMNAIFNTVSMEEFKRISNVEIAHTAWNILQIVHEGTKAVKINKLQQLTSKFESIRMSDDESFDEFYAKLNDIVNSTYNLGEIYDQPKIVRKILRSLTEDFRPKVTAITESKDVDFIFVDELVGSLQSYELDLPKTSKSKLMALKSIDDVDVGRFDDELSATKIAYLAKNFMNFLRNNNRRARDKNTIEPINFRKNDPTKVNNIEKRREKVGQSSNNSMGPQCFGCQGYGYMKSECPTYLKSKGKVMAVTFSDDKVFDDESGCNEDGNFIATATVVVNENVSVEENPSDGEFSEDANLQEAYNKLCKVATKDVMNVELGLMKIASLELEKKNLLVKLFDANDLLNNVKTENMLFLDKVKNLELELSVAKEQTDRFASFKLDHILSVQKSPSDIIGLGFIESISVFALHSTNFVPSSSSEPFVSEAVKPFMSEAKPIKVTPPRKIRVDLHESKPKAPNPSKGKTHDKPAWICHFCGKSEHIRPNCYKLQAAKRANKPKVPVPQTQDPMVLIGELVKALNLYSNFGVGNHSHVNKNSNARGASKKFWMQKAQSN